MARVLRVCSALLWVAGVVLLVLALLEPADVSGFPDICQFGDVECLKQPDLPRALTIGTALGGVAGLFATGLMARAAIGTQSLAIVAGVLWALAVLLLMIGIHQLAPLGVRLFGFPTLSDSLGRFYYGTAAVGAAGVLALWVQRR